MPAGSPQADEPLIIERRGAQPRLQRLGWKAVTVLLWLLFAAMLAPVVVGLLATAPIDDVAFDDVPIDGLPAGGAMAGGAMAGGEVAPLDAPAGWPGDPAAWALAGSAGVLLAALVVVRRQARASAAGTAGGTASVRPRPAEPAHCPADPGPFDPGPFDPGQIARLRKSRRMVVHHDDDGGVYAVTMLSGGPGQVDLAGPATAPGLPAVAAANPNGPAASAPRSPAPRSPAPWSPAVDRPAPRGPVAPAVWSPTRVGPALAGPALAPRIRGSPFERLPLADLGWQAFAGPDPPPAGAHARMASTTAACHFRHQDGASRENKVRESGLQPIIRDRALMLR